MSISFLFCCLVYASLNRKKINIINTRYLNQLTLNGWYASDKQLSRFTSSLLNIHFLKVIPNIRWRIIQKFSWIIVATSSRSLLSHFMAQIPAEYIWMALRYFQLISAQTTISRLIPKPLKHTAAQLYEIELSQVTMMISICLLDLIRLNLQAA